MSDPAKIGGRAWRENVKQERVRLVRELNAASDPKTFSDAMAQINLVRRLTKRYEDPQDKPGPFHSGSYLDSDLTPEQQEAARRALERIHAWFVITIDDARLERQFRFDRDLTYSGAQAMALATLGASRWLKQFVWKSGTSDYNWNEKIRDIERARAYVDALFNRPAAEATTADKVGGIIMLGVMAIPVVGLAVIGVPELLAAVGELSLVAAWGIPGAATLLTLVVEHYLLAEVLAAFALGTIVTIADSGIEGFFEQLKTPQGALVLAQEIFLIIQARGASGGGGPKAYRVRAQVQQRTSRGISVRVEEVEELNAGQPPVRLMRGAPAITPDATLARELESSAREELALAESTNISNKRRPGCVSVIRAREGGDYPGGSKMRSMGVLDEEVAELADVVQSALPPGHGFNGECAEPLSISNMIRSGTRTKGAVSIAINVRTGRVMDPCPNCRQLLLTFGMRWVNQQGQIEPRN